MATVSGGLSALMAIFMTLADTMQALLNSFVHSQLGIGCHIAFLVASIVLMTLLVVQAIVTDYQKQPEWYYVGQVLKSMQTRWRWRTPSRLDRA